MNKRALLLLVLAGMLVVGAVPAATYLKIKSPVSATIKVEAFGAVSPTINIRDNTINGSATTGEAAGYLTTAINDIYHLDFGKKAADDYNYPKQLVISPNQWLQVGSEDDAVLYIDNFSTQSLTLGISEAKGIPQGMTLEVWGSTPGGTATLAAKAAGTDTNLTNHILVPASITAGSDPPTIPAKSNGPGILNVFFVVETNNSLVTPDNTWDGMEIKLSATGA